MHAGIPRVSQSRSGQLNRLGAHEDTHLYSDYSGRQNLNEDQCLLLSDLCVILLSVCIICEVVGVELSVDRAAVGFQAIQRLGAEYMTYKQEHKKNALEKPEDGHDEEDAVKPIEIWEVEEYKQPPAITLCGRHCDTNQNQQQGINEDEPRVIPTFLPVQMHHHAFCAALMVYALTAFSSLFSCVGYVILCSAS